MELAPGGTLKDRVEAGGPLKPPEAVDAILQLIAGLDAAAAAGILHRDIKPSNCFLDSRGQVKIGDFGLSISTLALTEPTLTRTGTFMGTPAFAAPEQLRGEALDVRSDIYAVGATLFYLLTGRAPIEETESQTRTSRASLRNRRPHRGSCRRRSHQDSPPSSFAASQKHGTSGRFMTYAALTEALEIFSSKAIPPAPLGLRFAAGTLDLIAVGATLTFVMPYVLGRLVGPVLTVPLLVSGPDLVTDYFGHSPAWLLWLFPPASEAMSLTAHPRFGMASAIAQAVIALGYFIALEGIWVNAQSARPCADCASSASTVILRNS